MPYAPYSPYLVSSVYHLFRLVERLLREQHFFQILKFHKNTLNYFSFQKVPRSIRMESAN